jgi:P4 family phage/plasmid primase-like protien
MENNNLKSVYTQFVDIVKKTNTTNINKSTHILEIPSGDKINTTYHIINNDNENKLWDILDEYPCILNNVTIYEKFQDKTKVIIEINKNKILFDELSDNKSKVKLIPNNTRLNIISSLQHTMLNMYDIQNNESLTTIYIEDNNIIKLILPNIKIKYQTLTNDLINLFVHILNENKIFKYDDTKYTMKNIINTNIYNNKYKITYNYDGNNDINNDNDNDNTFYAIYNLIDIDNDESSSKLLNDDKIKDIFNIDKSKNITKITYCKLISFNYSDVPLLTQKKINNKNLRSITNTQLIAERKNDKKNSDIEILNQLKHFIKVNRCFNKSNLLNLGKCINNITKNDIKGLEIWEYIVQELIYVYRFLQGKKELIPDDKYNLICNNDYYQKLDIDMIENDIKNMINDDSIISYIKDEYNKFEFNNMTMGTFRFWCKSDNILLYNDWKNNNINSLLWKCISPTGGLSDIADILYKKYQDKFLCASIKDQEWFEFKNHRYQILDGGITIRKLLTDDIVPLFNDILTECNEKVSQLPEGIDQEKWKSKQDNCLKIIKGLKSPGYKTSVLKEASEKFYYHDFPKLCNKNKNLFVFENGVLDYDLIVKDSHPQDWFRDGTPDDLNTICCNHEFKIYKKDDQQLLDCEKYLKQVFVDDDVRYYFSNTLGGCLKGGNDRKEFIFLPGDGNNSKSVIESIIETAFGDYFAKPPTSLLTGKRTGSGNATPELEVLRYARIAMFQEPKSDDMLNDGILKELSSGFDTIYSRALNKMPEKIHPQFTPFMICNYIPRTNGSDRAIINRIRIIEFKSTFSRKYPKDEETQWKTRTFPIDEEFDKKIPSLVQPLMFILVKHLYDYKFKKNKIPTQVEMANVHYEQENDMFSMFIKDKIQQVNTNSDDDDDIEDNNNNTIIRCRIETVYNCYKLWITNNMPELKQPNIQKFKESMRRSGYKGDNIYYYNIKLLDN